MAFLVRTVLAVMPMSMMAMSLMAMGLPAVAGAADPADALAERFAAACMADASPYKSANDAAIRDKLEANAGLSGVDTPNPSHIVTTQTWHAGLIAGSEVSLVSTNVDSGKCRVQGCGVVAARFPLARLEAALTKRLKLAAPASRLDDTVAFQAAWPIATPPDQVVSLNVQKSLGGANVTLSIAQLCPQS